MTSLATYPFTSFARGGWGAAAPRHAIESIFVWLDLKSLITTTKVCKEWHAAVGTMAPGSYTVYTNVYFPVMSAIGKHITRLVSWLIYVSLEYIEVLALVAPRITFMILTFNSRRPEFTSILIRFQRLEELALYAIDGRWITLTPLTRITSLKKLTVVSADMDPTDDQVSEIRALGHLDTFKMPACLNTPERLQRILVEPHTLRWKEVSSIHTTDVANLFSALPSLTVLRGNDYVFLPRLMASLPVLQKLCVWGTGMLGRALQECRALTELRVCLEFSPTLEWANQPSLRTTLHTLVICRSWQGFKLQPEQLRYIFTLQSLCSLVLEKEAFTPELDDSRELSMLRPPSATMPRLQSLLLR
jgi:hypothetical protein